LGLIAAEGGADGVIQAQARLEEVLDVVGLRRIGVLFVKVVGVTLTRHFCAPAGGYFGVVVGDDIAFVPLSIAVLEIRKGEGFFKSDTGVDGDVSTAFMAFFGGDDDGPVSGLAAIKSGS